ncbi:hypothetical protein Adt_18964 [Abeliophyllum distichum]|uniref:Uncharacterized protein n=1 Tax=Abeliophyllum distichum TaxID=126358 RepID=A0ABD1TKX1_9LAMI
MGKVNKDLLASAPWRVGPQEEDNEKFKDGKLKVTNQPSTTTMMHVPGKKKSKNDAVGDDSLTEIDPELRYSFQWNILLKVVNFVFLGYSCEEILLLREKSTVFEARSAT